MNTDNADDFTVYPAIDVRDGRVVRLRQGDYARETRYAGDPLVVAEGYAAQGAEWLHLVDLDAARAGGCTLAPLLGRIREATPLRVQAGGGVRGEADVQALLEAGAERVVIGSLAASEPERVAGWLREFGGDALTMALDLRADAASGDWRAATHGWTETAGDDVGTLLGLYADAGLQHLLCTDIARDGMLSGPNFALYARLRELAPTLRVQASGGASTLEDVKAARARGCAGIVLGRALLEGRFALAEALAC